MPAGDRCGGAGRARRRGAPGRRTPSRLRGRMRAASGWRSGGGWKSASGRAPVGRRAWMAWPDGSAARPAPAGSDRAAIPATWAIDPEDEQDQDQRAADDGDPRARRGRRRRTPRRARTDEARRGPRPGSSVDGRVRVRSPRLRAASAACSSATIWASSSGRAGLLLVGQASAGAGDRGGGAPGCGPADVGRPLERSALSGSGACCRGRRLAMVCDGSPPCVVGAAGRHRRVGRRAADGQRIASAESPTRARLLRLRAAPSEDPRIDLNALVTPYIGAARRRA